MNSFYLILYKADVFTSLWGFEIVPRGEVINTGSELVALSTVPWEHL